MGTLLGIWPASLEHGGGGGYTNVSRCDCPPMKNGKCPVSHSLRYTAKCLLELTCKNIFEICQI